MFQAVAEPFSTHDKSAELGNILETDKFEGLGQEGQVTSPSGIVGSPIFPGVPLAPLFAIS